MDLSEASKSPSSLTEEHTTQAGTSDTVSMDAEGQARRAGLAIRCEDILQSLERLSIQAIERADKNTALSLVAHCVDDIYSDMQLWLYDVGVRNSVRGWGPRSLSGYDVLEILETHSASVRSKISQQFLLLEQSTDKLNGRLAGDSSTSFTDDEVERYQESLQIALKGLNRLKKIMREEVDQLAAEDESKLEPEKKPPSILSLDGGGVRSLSSLLILEELMRRVASLSFETNDTILPRDIFDYIFGSSSGGLAAIMLGRLKMTVSASTSNFKDHAKKVFSRPRWRYVASGGFIGPKYRGDSIWRSSWSVVKGVSEQAAGSERWNLNVFAAPSDSCKTAVAAMASPKIIDPNSGAAYSSDSDSAHDRGSGQQPVAAPIAYTPTSPTRRSKGGERPIFLRTYHHAPREQRYGENRTNETQNHPFSTSPLSEILEPFPHSGMDDDLDDEDSGAASTCEIWQAARATSAAPLYFPNIRIDDRVMSDGGFGLNNPSLQGLREVVMAGDSLLGGVFVSVGTGANNSRTSSFYGAATVDSGVVIGGGSNVVRVAQRAVNTATNVNVAEGQMSVLAPQLGLRYFRFDVPGICDIALDEWKKMPTLEHATIQYLKSERTQRKLDECAKLLVRIRRARR